MVYNKLIKFSFLFFFTLRFCFRKSRKVFRNLKRRIVDLDKQRIFFHHVKKSYTEG